MRNMMHTLTKKQLSVANLKLLNAGGNYEIIFILFFAIFLKLFFKNKATMKLNFVHFLNFT